MRTKRILQKKSKTHEIFLARTEKDARRESCRIVSSLQDLFHAKNRAGCKIYFLQRLEVEARNISCKDWKQMHEIMFAKMRAGCRKYFLRRMETDARNKVCKI